MGSQSRLRASRISGNSRPKESRLILRDKWGIIISDYRAKFGPYDVNSLPALFGYLEDVAENQSPSAMTPLPKRIAANDAPGFG